MTLLFNDCQSEGEDTDSDILACILQQRKRDALKRDIPRHYCGIGPNPDPTKIEPKPCLPKRKNVCTRNPFCPQRTTELSIPKLNLIINTIKCYNRVLEPRRIVNLVKMVHEINEPKPKTCSLLNKKRRRRKHKRGKKCKKSRASCERIWLEKQSDESAKLVINYIRTLPRYTPNYKQLHVALYMMRWLKLKKRKSIKKCVKTEICKIFQQLAVLVDTKWEPYKRTLKIEPVKSKSTVASEDKKHCIFNLMDFEFDSEEEEGEGEIIAEEEEEEEEEEIEWQGEEEGLMEEWEVQGEAESEGAGEYAGEYGGKYAGEGEGGEEGSEGWREGWGRGEGEDESGREGRGREGGEDESLRGRGWGEGEDEGYIVEEEIVEDVEPEEEEEGLVERAWDIAEAIEALLEEEEEEEMGIAGFDGHPDDTSSYVSWCLYSSWLNEFGKNITMYGTCLNRFKACVASDGASKHNEIITLVLKNWSKYLGDVMRVDQNMVQYFKKKPITRCSKCRDCDIYDYPTDHDIPQELLEAVQTTIQWKKLLEEAEKHCKSLVCGADVVAESISMASMESVEILDVSSSDSSGFIIEDLHRRS